MADRADRFRVNAYNGGVVSLFWWGLTVFDVSGLYWNEKFVALREHVRDREVGVIDTVRTTQKGVITEEGYFLEGSPDADKIRRYMEQGLPWQASIGVSPEEVEFLEEGEKAKVNGKTVEGPVIILRKGQLFETSFVTAGADKQTSVVPLAASLDTSDTKEKEGTMKLEEILAKLKEAKPSREDLAAAFPELFAESQEFEGSVTEEAAQEMATAAAGTEQERAVAIYAHLHGEEAGEQFKTLVASGVTIEQVQAFAPLKPAGQQDKMDEMLKEIKAADPDNPGPDATPVKDNLDHLSLEERCAEEFKTSPELQEEFESAEHYTAFMKASEGGQVKLLSRKEDK